MGFVSSLIESDTSLCTFSSLEYNSLTIIHELNRTTIKDLMYTTIKQSSLAKYDLSHLTVDLCNPISVHTLVICLWALREFN
jgi:hypothetical protein